MSPSLGDGVGPVPDPVPDTPGTPGSTEGRAPHGKLAPPWPKGVSGNPSGRAKRPTLEALARKECEQGALLMEVAGKFLRGEPIARTVVKLLPRKLRTPERIYEEFTVPYYPTPADVQWAWERICERGWGKPKQEVVLDEGGASGFTMVFRHWPPGVDPLAPPEKIIEGKGRALPPGAGA